MTWEGLEQAVRVIAETAVERRETWDRLDAAVGDGDFGSSAARGFSAVLAEWDALDRTSPGAFLGSVGSLLGRHMGGSSGPLLSVAFSRAGAAVGDTAEADTAVVARMLRAALGGIEEYGRGAAGDKTLLDALVPATAALEAAAAGGGGDAVAAAARAAADGAEATRHLVARRGRAAYAAERSLGAPDPGAVAVAVVAGRLAARLGRAAPDTAGLEVPVTERAGEATPEAAAARSAPTKKFVNDPDDAASEALAGFAKAWADLVRWDPARRIVTRAGGAAAGQVGLVSGGGSGHEPLHGGFVGRGMLSAVAPGPVFASPTTEQVLAATRAADGGAGVLHIVKNYTGDLINFGLAADEARAGGLPVAAVVVDDDVAVDGSAHTVGRRGTGATVLVHKMAGALAGRGAPLEEVRRVAEATVHRSASFGVALTSCSPPGAGPILDLGPDEMEVGVGIHGERGRRRERVRSAREIVAEATGILLGALDLGAGAEVLAFVNGFGGTPNMELYLLFDALHDELAARGVGIARSLVGSYVTSLEMAGASFTLLALDPTLLELWDAPVHTPALRWGA